jgi:thioredoxin-related protein
VEDKRKQAIHESSFEDSLKDEDTHKEWLAGETSQISANAVIRGRRADAVDKMFRARKHAAQLVTEVTTVHGERLKKSIKNQKEAIEILKKKTAMWESAKKAHADAKEVSKKAVQAVARGVLKRA